MDESYSDQKNLFQFYVGKSTLPLSGTVQGNYPQSHNAVLNNFRSDFEDFSTFTDLSLKTSKASSSSSLTLSDSDLITTKGDSLVGTSSLDVTPYNSNVSRFSNPIALRRTAKGSMVTYQAFQKVFKLRYDEGRAHVRLTDFSDTAVAQPFTTEQRIKYDRMLGKTKVKHFNTNYNVFKALPIVNDIAGLSNSLNYYFFEFPFLDGVTNDPTRHV
jgi:hypothetical protein